MDPIRSVLYVPAHREGWVAEAASHGADAVILDLEDAVPTDEKDAARAAVRDHADALAAADTTVTLRVNDVGTAAFHEDAALVDAWTDAVVLPKTESPADVHTLDSVLAYVEHQRNVRNRIEVVPLLESPAGVCAVGDIAGASLGLGWSPEGDETAHVRSKIVLEAKAAGVEQVLSGIWASIDDEAGLREKAERQKRFGFTGMQVVHPSQVDAVNDVFTPSGDELDYYRDLVAAFEAETDGEQGAIRFDGEMVDAAKVKQARRALERADTADGESS
ncbi:MAG: CoA ester lyase [Haloglomus sp.]